MRCKISFYSKKVFEPSNCTIKSSNPNLIILEDTMTMVELGVWKIYTIAAIADDENDFQWLTVYSNDNFSVSIEVGNTVATHSYLRER